MVCCFVCGAELEPDVVSCESCSSQFAVLQQVSNKAQRRAFLFAKMGSEPPADGQPEQESESEISTQKAAYESDHGPLFRDFEDVPLQEQIDAIYNRDMNVIGDSDRPGPLPHKLVVFLIDMAFCLGFDIFILQLILWSSSRNFTDLITFSLIPLLFIIFGFTLLYFWIFLGAFRKTLGAFIFEIYHRKNNAGS